MAPLTKAMFYRKVIYFRLARFDLSVLIPIPMASKQHNIQLFMVRDRHRKSRCSISRTHTNVRVNRLSKCCRDNELMATRLSMG